MPGNKTHLNGTFVTRLRTYRLNVAAVDVVATRLDSEGEEIPDLDMLKETEQISNTKAKPNKHGSDLDLFLYARLSEVSAATLELWMENIPFDLESAGSSDGPGDGYWFHVGSQDVTQSERVLFEDLVPGKYKVLVTSLTPDGGSPVVDLYEQHGE